MKSRPVGIIQHSLSVNYDKCDWQCSCQDPASYMAQMKLTPVGTEQHSFSVSYENMKLARSAQ